MSNWVPLHNHSMFSMLNGVSKPKQMAQRCAELGQGACGLMDHGGISAGVQYIAAMKDAGIKPLLGSELNLCEGDPTVRDNSEPSQLPVLAKNLKGWKNLIRITSFAHHKDHFHRKPRIDLDNLSRLADGQLIGFSGHAGSDLANLIFTDPQGAYDQTDYDTVTSRYIHPDWKDRIRHRAGEHIEVFGRDNFFLTIQVLDAINNPAGLVAARAMRWLSKKDKIQRVATANSYYPRKTDAGDQRVLLCAAMKTTLKQMIRRTNNITEKGLYFRKNFRADCFYMPSAEEIRQWHIQAFEEVDEESLANSLRIADMCESYDIRNAPIMPIYPCPDGMSADDYLMKLCRRGWRSKIEGPVDGEYTDRVRKELGVIRGAGLASYFLIVQDYCNWAKRQGMIIGPGRGSGAGCLVSYLIGITNVDPIEHGLLFERFYNAGRNAPGHISLPDIDCDFPIGRRKEIVVYLKGKYGDSMVANIATFNSMKGRGALTDVLRAHDTPFELVKRITSNIPEEHRITEELQLMKDKGEEPSIIRYALENDPDSFKEWCVLRDDGEYEGSLSPYFAQAIRLEGTKRNISTHAAGVVLASTPLADMCPLVYDSEIDGYIAGMEYPDLEAMGQVKLDVLGVAALDKIAGVQRLLRYGYIDHEDAAA